MNKMWSVHTIEHSALNRKEVLTPAAAWMNLEDTMLNEISWSQKDKYCLIPLYKVPRVIIIKTEGRIRVSRGWGQGDVKL